MTEHTSPTTVQDDKTRPAGAPPTPTAPSGEPPRKTTLSGREPAKTSAPTAPAGGGGAQQPPTDTPPGRQRHSQPLALIMALAAMLVAIALAVWLYTLSNRQAHSQQEVQQQLQSNLDQLKNQQQQQTQQYLGQLKQQGEALEAARSAQDAQARQLTELKEKIAAISGGSDAKTWLLAQADFLVKMAGRKLWGDQDVVTAGALLKSADTSLAEMNDPSLTTVRRALTDDIASLAGVSQVDFDGIILKVNQLSNQVDNLRLADNDSDDTPMDSDSTELSGTVREWRQNLTKSWHNFMNDFITVRRRDTSAEPLLAPNQDIYLRENIRSRLLIAAQAIPRHQNEVYQQSLETVSTWVRAYFDSDDAATRAFLSQVDDLSAQDITLDVPAELKSQPLLEKVMQTRVRNLLAQPQASASPPAPAGQEE